MSDQNRKQEDDNFMYFLNFAEKKKVKAVAAAASADNHKNKL